MGYTHSKPTKLKGDSMTIKHFITMSNDLVPHYAKLSINEQMLIRSALARHDSMSSIEDAQPIKLTVNDLKQDFGDAMSPHICYKLFTSVAKDLVSKSFKIQVTKGSNPITTTYSNWFAYATFHHDIGTITLSFSPSILPAISEISGNFNSQLIDNTSKLKFQYSVSLYTLLRPFLNLKVRELEIDEIKDLLGLGPKYDRMDKFQTNVIKKAIKEINKNTDIHIKAINQSYRNKIYAIKFHISSTRRKASAKPAATNNMQRQASGLTKISNFTKLIHGSTDDARPGESLHAYQARKANEVLLQN